MYSGVLLTKGRRQDFGLIWQHCTELCFSDVHGETSNLKNHWTVNSMSDDSTHLKSFNSPALTDLAVNNSYVPTSNKCDTQCIIHCSLCIQRFALDSCTLHHFTSLQKNKHWNKNFSDRGPSSEQHPSAFYRLTRHISSATLVWFNPLLRLTRHISFCNSDRSKAMHFSARGASQSTSVQVTTSPPSQIQCTLCMYTCRKKLPL